MKKLFTYLILTCFAWTAGQAQITLPYSEDLESEATGSISCGAAQTLTTINWTNEVTDDVDWVIDVSGTGSTNTGPTANGGADHNPGVAGGKYLYIEASGCATDVALLTSDDIITDGSEPNLSFEFWYHQFGAQIERLIVNTRQVTGGVPGPWVPLDTLFTPPPGIDAWQLGSYDFASFIGDTFQIQFNGLTGTSFGSDLALDDISLFSVFADDAGISAIDGPSSPAPGGTNNVAVSVTNFGVNNLTTATINWEFNGVLQTPFNYVAPLTGLPTNVTEGGVVIGTGNVTPGIFTVKAWTTLPNGVTDSVAANDTSSVTGCGGALRGSYTVGGAGADFANMTDLGFVLSTCGIDSHTVINVSPGIYNERLILTSVPGTSDTSTLTIDGGNAATIRNGTFSNIYLNGTSYTTIKNLTLEVTGTTDNYGVQLRDSASFNTIDSCLIVMNDSATNMTDVIGVSASNTETSAFSELLNAYFTTVSNCTITGGEKGVHYEGDAGNGNRNVGNSCINNIFLNQEDYGIYVDEQDSLTIVGNTISGLRSTFADGMLLFDIMMFNIEGNTIDAPDYGLNIEDGNFETAPTSRGRIVNNMITSSSDRGLDLDDLRETDIFHNTVAIATTIANNGALYVNDLTDCDIRNNIFYCEGAFALYSLDDLITVGANTVDYNIYYTTGPSLIDAGPLVHADLASWQGAQATLNLNSLETDPLFLGGLNDLHLFAPGLDDLGDNTAGVLVDIDGEVRPQGTNVDIGADEFTPLQDDAGVSAILNPVSPATVGLNDVVVEITNYGADTLESTTIEWELDGVAQTPYAHTDSLLSGDSRGGLILGNTTVTAGVFYTIKAWTVLPNGVLDLQNANDTTEITGCGALRGVYTAGGLGADFPDMTTLANVLSSCGIDSTTVININPGFYNERFILENVPGTNDSTTLTINGGSADSVTISFDNLATVALVNTHYTTIKNVTIENTAATNAYGVQFRDSASFNLIDSCLIVVDSSGTTSLAAGVMASASETSTTTQGKNAYWNTVSNNTIRGGYYGVRFTGQLANRNVGNMVMNNTFFNQYLYGTYVQYQDSISLIGNDISDLIQVGADGMYHLDVQEFNISENNVVANDYGIYVSDGNFDFPPTSRAKVINNMVSSSSDRGLYFDDVNDVDVYHNSIAASISGNNGAFYTNDITNLDVRNNVFFGNGSFAYYSLDAISGAAGNFFDYNAYYTNGANLADVGPVYLDLAAWQTATPAWNANSVEGDPVFVSEFDDLHLVGAVANDVGDNTVGILVDIDGDVRPDTSSTVVDMGADEYTPLLNDAVGLEILGFASNCGDSATLVRVLIRNLGQNPITSLPVNVDYSGAASGNLSFTYLGSLAFGAYDTVTVGTINTYAGGTFTLDGYVSLVADENLSNDTLSPISQEFTPFIPQGLNGFDCGTDSAIISAIPYGGAGYFWYQSNNPLDTIPVGMGVDFLVPSLAAQDTYYLGYANNSDSLFVSVAGGNGQAGNMFDIVALNTVNVTGLGMNLNTGNNVVEIWYRPDSYTNNPNSAVGWTQLGSAAVTSPGNGVVTQVPITFDVTIPAGQTYGFLAICTTGGVDYTNGTTVGNVWAQNADMQVLEGLGRAVPPFTGATFSPRNFNGQIYYGSTACSDVRTPVAALATPGVSVDLGSDTVLCGSSLDLDAGTNADFYAWSTGDSVQVVTATTSGSYDVMVSDSIGCEAMDTIAVIINTPPTVSLGGDVDLCGTDTVTLNATGTTPVSYAWSTSDTTQSVDVNASGTYSVVVTDSVGCTDTDTMVLTYLPDATYDTAVAGCGAYTWIDGNTYLVDTLVAYVIAGGAANGCDSVINLDLDVTIVDTGVTQTGATLTANANNVIYTWVDCNNGNAPIPNETTQSFTATANGSYAVQISDAGCVVQSACFTVTGLSIREFGDGSLMNLYPNPTENNFTVDFGSTMKDASVKVMTVDGRVMQIHEDVDGDLFEISLENYPAGMYFVEVTSQQGTVTSLKVSKF